MSIPKAKPSSNASKSFGKKTAEKKKSQLELFKEEIKAQHDAREALKAEQRQKAKLTGQALPSSYPLTAASDQVSNHTLLYNHSSLLRASYLHFPHALKPFGDLDVTKLFCSYIKKLFLGRSQFD